MGTDTIIDAIQARKQSLNAELAIIANIEAAVALDQSVDANRETLKGALVSAANDIDAADYSGRALEDKVLFKQQVTDLGTAEA